MGNGMFSPCFHPAAGSRNGHVKLVFWGGGTKLLPAGRHLAGGILAEMPDRIVCDGGAFFIGQPVPAMSIEDELLPGRTYFVLPVDRFPVHQLLTAASIARLSPGPKRPSLSGPGQCPFEYVNGADGRMAIRVLPEFIARNITSAAADQEVSGDDDGAGGTLCSTPELRKHYAQLVGAARDRPWSPKLETISEREKRKATAAAVAGRLSPVRLLGLDRKTSLNWIPSI